MRCTGQVVGGLKALIARADANTRVLADWKARRRVIDFLAKDTAIAPTPRCA